MVLSLKATGWCPTSITGLVCALDGDCAFHRVDRGV